MWKRDLLRRFPGLSRLANALDEYESRHARLSTANQQLEATNQQLDGLNQQLKNLVHQLIFTREKSLDDTGIPDSCAGEDELPVPPGILRFLVAGTEHLEWFLRSGKLGAQTLVEILGRQGKTLEHCKRILDFGCGCGRVLRHLRGLSGAELYGADANPRAIRWCEKYLDFAQFKLCSLEPGLPFADSMFDLIYVFSVFTHLTEPLQARWMEELRRILVPTGYLILTVHGDSCLEWLPPANRMAYDKGNLVIIDGAIPGTNYCSAYHPPNHVRNVLARGFEVIDFIQQGAKGNPPQDAYLLRRLPDQPYGLASIQQPFLARPGKEPERAALSFPDGTHTAGVAQE